MVPLVACSKAHEVLPVQSLQLLNRPIRPRCQASEMCRQNGIATTVKSGTSLFTSTVTAVGAFTMICAVRWRKRCDRRWQRRQRKVFCQAVDKSTTDVDKLPSGDFSDTLAEALKGGPPLRIDSTGDVSFDFAPAGGTSGIGSRVKWGLFKEEIAQDAIDNTPEAQSARAALREAAARNLTNIDDQERERRRLVGLATVAGALVLALLMLWSKVDWSVRLAIFPIVALGNGYLLSAQEGL